MSDWRAIGNAPGLSGPPDEPEWLAGQWLDDMDDADACELAVTCMDGLPNDDASERDYAEAIRAAYRADVPPVVDFVDRKYQSHLDGLNDY